jgi:hypothetical protein
VRCLALGAVLGCLGAAPAARAASGGPDTFGYTWRDSAEPGVTFAWEDIQLTGRDIGVDGDDVNLGFVPLSFPMPYYGGAYTQVAACSNGWVSFVDDVSSTWTNGALPSAAAPLGTIAAFWDDLRITTGTSRVLFQDLGDHAVIQWAKVHDLGDVTAVNTFEVILYPDGRIKVQYLDMRGDRTSCTVGIESPDDTDGLTVYQDEPAGVPAALWAVELAPPSPIPNDLDCAGATPVACGDWVPGDLAAGAARQAAYRCVPGDHSGREQVYRLDLTAPTDVRIFLDSTSGAADLLVLPGCDPNACTSSSGDDVEILGGTGTWWLVVDCAPGSEETYRLRVECLPVPADLACATAVPVACGETVSGDLGATGVANQDVYWCTRQDLSGREHVYRLDVPLAQTLRIVLRQLSGRPQLLVLQGCDPSTCASGPGTSALIDPALGTYDLVVDSGPGDEGRYELSVECLSLGPSFPFCSGALFESDRWANGTGSWLVEGWLYHPGDTHSFALRVDGTTTYTHEAFGGCPQFPSALIGSVQPAGPGLVEWAAPEGAVTMTMSPTLAGGCCGLLVEIEVTNTDSVAHSYDFRVYHDTAFGSGTGACPGTVDGGPIVVDGTRYDTEVDLLAIGGTTCEGQVQMFSADDGGASLRGSYQMLPPNLPTTMEFLDWDTGGSPCTAWNDLVTGQTVSGCSGFNGDSSLLFIWRFPDGGGVLEPGESAVARYRIGWQCAFPCAGCEDPVLSSGAATDIGPCHDGVRLTWAPAVFPGSGIGAYHVYRSTTSFADATTRPPVARSLPAAGWVDSATLPGATYYYVVQAESLEYPGCGAGPDVTGSTDEIQLGPVRDDADLIGPMSDVGPALRATGHADDTVDFDWSRAGAAPPGEHHVVLRSDDDPQGPFGVVASVPGLAWTDPFAPPRFVPVHVWFYDVRRADACDNLSVD